MGLRLGLLMYLNNDGENIRLGRAISEVLSPVKAMLFLVAHYKKDEDIYDGSSCWSQL